MEENYLIQDIAKAEASKQARKVTDRRTKKPLWREYLETAILALVSAILLRMFVVSAYQVNSASMEDALYEGDFIFVNKLAYEFDNAPKAGDIIVFKYPNNPQKEYIKRIVAVGGETVTVADKIVYVNEEVAMIPVTTKNTDKRIIPGDLSFRDNFGPYLVNMDEYFVVGDNRDDSRDSRFWGTVPRDHIVGKAVFVYWSWQPGDSPAWEFPYVFDLFHWIGYAIYNAPTHIRWERIGISL